MPSRILTIPFVLLLLVFGYLTWNKDESYLYYVIPLVVIIVLIYVLAPQIDWWWYERYPPDVDAPVKKMLDKTNPFYNQLNTAEKKKFRNRLQMFVIGNNFMPKGWEKIPEDAKYAIAANAVQITFHKKEFLIPQYENIVVYPNPFPSPQYPEHFHPSESFKEDGVMLFSAEQIMWALVNPTRYYNVAMHEYVKVFIENNPSLSFPAFTEEDWPQFAKASPYTEEHIRNLLNVPDIDPTIVGTTLFQIFPDQFAKIFPEKAKLLRTAFA